MPEITDAKAFVPVGFPSLLKWNYWHYNYPLLTKSELHCWPQYLDGAPISTQGKDLSLPIGPGKHCCQPIPFHKSPSKRQTPSATPLWLRRLFGPIPRKCEIFFFLFIYLYLSRSLYLWSHRAIPSCWLYQTSFFAENIPLCATLLFPWYLTTTVYTICLHISKLHLWT